MEQANVFVRKANFDGGNFESTKNIALNLLYFRIVCVVEVHGLIVVSMRDKL